jgi:chromosome segregation ATPase
MQGSRAICSFVFSGIGRNRQQKGVQYRKTSAGKDENMAQLDKKTLDEQIEQLDRQIAALKEERKKLLQQKNDIKRELRAEQARQLVSGEFTDTLTAAPSEENAPHKAGVDYQNTLLGK